MRYLIALSLLIAAPAAGNAADPNKIAADAPQLAPRGAMPVGTVSLDFTFPDRPDVLHPDPEHGGFARTDRNLPIEVWYPATAAGDGKQRATYRMPPPLVPGPQPAIASTISFTGKATRGAAPAKGRFPLVVMSHGYKNRAVMFSALAENLASKGYVVASIEHGDKNAEQAGSQLLSFMLTVVNRSADQRFVIDELTRRAKTAKDGPLAHVDAKRIALAGYSMGGFGALTTAGAGYDPSGALYKQIPGGLLDGLAEGKVSAPANLKALIAFAPWGGGLPNRMWTAKSLSTIDVPTLLIDGDHDDVADYSGGVDWIYKAMTGSERYMLVYRGARHNIAMNAAPPALASDFRYLERFNEPVWRKSRILAVNGHLITAFLNWRLKGVTDDASYLNVPTPIAADGKWPLSPGEEVGAKFATPDGETAGHWRGFHRRWALGLELHHRAEAQ